VSSHPQQQTKKRTKPTRLHIALVTTNELQDLSTRLVFAVIVINALLVTGMWAALNTVADGLLVGAGHFMAAMFNWWLLQQLPKRNRSYGPDKPSALALSALMGAELIIPGILSLPFWTGWLFLALVTAVAYYATWIEPFRLEVTQQSLTTDKWPATDKPLRLLHISDLHVERITQRERELNRLIENLQPDIIVFTGDFVNISYNQDETAEQHVRDIISEWHAPLGVFCVRGTPNVEPAERVEAFVKDLDNLRLLNNQWITLETPGGELNILGLITTHDLPTDREALKKMMMVAPKRGLHLVLAHSPDIAPEASETGFDLYLCGHTHGGQVRLPLYGAFITSSRLGKRFEMGRYTLKQMTLYVSRGVGLEGYGAPRARFLCKPEITLWEINRIG